MILEDKYTLIDRDRLMEYNLERPPIIDLLDAIIFSLLIMKLAELLTQTACSH